MSYRGGPTSQPSAADTAGVGSGRVVAGPGSGAQIGTRSLDKMDYDSLLLNETVPMGKSALAAAAAAVSAAMAVQGPPTGDLLRGSNLGASSDADGAGGVGGRDLGEFKPQVSASRDLHSMPSGTGGDWHRLAGSDWQVKTVELLGKDGRRFRVSPHEVELEAAPASPLEDGAQKGSVSSGHTNNAQAADGSPTEETPSQGWERLCARQAARIAVLERKLAVLTEIETRPEKLPKQEEVNSGQSRQIDQLNQLQGWLHTENEQLVAELERALNKIEVLTEEVRMLRGSGNIDSSVTNSGNDGTNSETAPPSCAYFSINTTDFEGTSEAVSDRARLAAGAAQRVSPKAMAGPESSPYPASACPSSPTLSQCTCQCCNLRNRCCSCRSNRCQRQDLELCQSMVCAVCRNSSLSEIPENGNRRPTSPSRGPQLTRMASTGTCMRQNRRFTGDFGSKNTESMPSLHARDICEKRESMSLYPITSAEFGSAEGSGSGDLMTSGGAPESSQAGTRSSELSLMASSMQSVSPLGTAVVVGGSALTVPAASFAFATSSTPSYPPSIADAATSAAAMEQARGRTRKANQGGSVEVAGYSMARSGSPPQNGVQMPVRHQDRCEPFAFRHQVRSDPTAPTVSETYVPVLQKSAMRQQFSVASTPQPPKPAVAPVPVPISVVRSVTPPFGYRAQASSTSRSQAPLLLPPGSPGSPVRPLREGAHSLALPTCSRPPLLAGYSATARPYVRSVTPGSVRAASPLTCRTPVAPMSPVLPGARGGGQRQAAAPQPQPKIHQRYGSFNSLPKQQQQQPQNQQPSARAMTPTTRHRQSVA
eukprot:TRINITY_DN1744_c1_g2_i1.p1 TRINITY_DN1744_c1_g2~~TRINITY_DN1744_c1_g2_i1.p1  ORF type:complete len:822 (-),score=116.14 TRINITY_DN1744_c1_g2_i1:150-2615(-)